MKIISGIYKGRDLDGFSLEGTRPTMDRVKESLFAMIQEHIPESRVLDLFSGSGNLGIEALSEGAKEAYLADKNKKAISIIKKNIQKIGVKDCQVLEGDYLVILKELKDRNINFDLIFLDPPYQTDYIEKSVLEIAKLQLLKEDGLLICESSDKEHIKYPSTMYKIYKEKKYSNKWVVILKQI